MRIVKWLLVILVFFPASGVAQENRLTAFGEGVRLLLRNTALSNLEKITVGQGFEQVCGDLETRIPTLSPKEEIWVESEIEGGRVKSLYDSEEFAKRQAKRTLRECYLFASFLRNTIESYRENSPENKYEVLLWLNLLNATTDWNLRPHVENLVRKKVPQITQIDADMLSFFNISSSLIIRNILIPMMKRE